MRTHQLLSLALCLTVSVPNHAAVISDGIGIYTTYSGETSVMNAAHGLNQALISEDAVAIRRLWGVYRQAIETYLFFQYFNFHDLGESNRVLSASVATALGAVSNPNLEIERVSALYQHVLATSMAGAAANLQTTMSEHRDEVWRRRISSALVGLMTGATLAGAGTIALNHLGYASGASDLGALVISGLSATVLTRWWLGRRDERERELRAQIEAYRAYLKQLEAFSAKFSPACAASLVKESVGANPPL